MSGLKNAKEPEVSGKDRVSRLRGWLPSWMARGSAFNRRFILVVVAIIVTCLFSALGMTNPPDGGVAFWLYEVGVVFSSVFLGFSLSNWWTAWDKGDDNRLAAEKIDDKVEEEIQWISENLKQIANSVSLLKDPPEGFFQATRFMLTAQLTAVSGRIERMVLEIDRLGYNSGDFLEEKKKRFGEIHTRVRELMDIVPQQAGLQGMDKAVTLLISGLGRATVALPEHPDGEMPVVDVEPTNEEEDKHK